MKGHFKSKKHLMKIGTVAVASAIWVVIRTGRKPSRIVYPCQRTALANIHVFLLLAFAPLLDSGRLRKSLPYVVNHPLTKAVCLLSLLLLALGSVTVTNNMSPGSIYLPVPLILKTQRALDTVSSSDIFFVESSSGFEGNMDDSVSRLLQLMEDHEKFFFETASQPAGLIHKDDVVLIKVNCQWSQRGGTNTDLVKSLIEEIVDHPEGFTGEIIVADNGQGRGSLDWAGSNAHNHSQSMQDVVNGFSSFKVSTWLWDPMRTLSVSEYNEADFNDGYIVNSTQDPITQIRVSYPKCHI